MLKLLNSESDGVASSEICDLFTPPVTQLAVASSKVVEHNPVNSLAHAPIEFNITGSKSFLDLQSSYLYVRCKVVNDKGGAVAAPTAGQSTKYALINLFGQTFVKQFQLFVGNELIYDSGIHNHYLSYINSVLSYDSSYKETVLAAAGWVPEEFPESAADEGYLARATAAQKEQEFVTRLNIPLFNQPRALIPWTNVRLLIYPNSDHMLIEQRDGTPRDLHISYEDVKLCVRHLYLYDSALIQINKQIEAREGVTYSLRHLASRTFYVSQGRKSIPEHSLFLSTIPRRIFIFFVSAEAFNGSYGTNPFVFKHYDLTTLSVETSNGDVFPARPYITDIPRGLYKRAYYDLMDTLQYPGSGDTCGITPEEFATHTSIFAIDLGCSKDPSVQLLRTGETTIRAVFAQPIPNGGVHVCAIADFDSSLHITHERVPRIDVIA